MQFHFTSGCHSSTMFSQYMITIQYNCTIHSQLSHKSFCAKHLVKLRYPKTIFWAKIGHHTSHPSIKYGHPIKLIHQYPILAPILCQNVVNRPVNPMPETISNRALSWRVYHGISLGMGWSMALGIRPTSHMFFFGKSHESHALYRWFCQL